MIILKMCITLPLLQICASSKAWELRVVMKSIFAINYAYKNPFNKKGGYNMFFMHIVHLDNTKLFWFLGYVDGYLGQLDWRGRPIEDNDGIGDIIFI